MKKLIYTNNQSNIIYLTIYLRPEIFINSEVVLGSIQWDNIKKKYQTDVNPYRYINGPLSEYGEELEPPIREEYDEFIQDCLWLIDNAGFTIIKQETSQDSKKSEYVIVFGMEDDPCGTLVFDLRISDHPFDATFPEELKDEVIDLLKMDKVLDGSATKAGINFRIEKVTIGAVVNDSWSRAFDRLGNVLDKMRNRVRKQLNRERREGKRN